MSGEHQWSGRGGQEIDGLLGSNPAAASSVWASPPNRPAPHGAAPGEHSGTLPEDFRRFPEDSFQLSSINGLSGGFFPHQGQNERKLLTSPIFQHGSSPRNSSNETRSALPGSVSSTATNMLAQQ